jgi:hypothetical protein
MLAGLVLSEVLTVVTLSGGAPCIGGVIVMRNRR